MAVSKNFESYSLYEGSPRADFYHSVEREVSLPEITTGLDYTDFGRDT